MGRKLINVEQKRIVKNPYKKGQLMRECVNIPELIDFFCEKTNICLENVAFYCIIVGRV